jgi:hypothetical protein
MSEVIEMSVVWEEPEYLRQARELATKFNEMSGVAGLQKSISAFQSALEVPVLPSSIIGVAAALKSISATMIDAKTQSQLRTLVSSKMTVSAAVQMSEALQSATDTLQPMYEMQAGLRELIGNMQWLDTLQESQAWQKNITGMLEAITPLLPKIDVQVFAKPLIESNMAFKSFLADYAVNFNFDELEIQDGALAYDGCEYSIDDLEQELSEELTAIENGQPLRERFEKNNVLFIIGILIYLFLMFPQIDEALPWYGEKFNELQTYVQSLTSNLPQEVFAFTIKDITYLRLEPNAKSGRLATIVHDTRLRIISSETPRWLYVEYTDEQGNTLTGWVSKVSVEIDE